MEGPPTPIADDVSVNSSEGHQDTWDTSSSDVFSSFSLCKVYRANLGTLSRVTFYHKGQTHLRDHPELQQHLDILSLHRHPNVATVFSVESEPGQTSLLVEHPQCGEFAAYVKTHVVTWSQVVGITRDVLTGLTFIEASSRGVSRGVRVSIGLANVWMFSRDVAKVACCGLSLVDQTNTGTSGASLDEALASPASAASDVANHMDSPRLRADIHSFGMTLLAMMECLQGLVTEPSQTLAYQNIPQRFANISPECPKELIHLVEICLGRAGHDNFTFSDLYLVFQSLYPLKLFSVWDVSLHNAIVPKHQKWVVYRRQLFEVAPKTAAEEPGSDVDLESREDPVGGESPQGVNGSTLMNYVGDCFKDSVDRLCDGSFVLCDNCGINNQHCQCLSKSVSCDENMCVQGPYNQSTIVQGTDHDRFSECRYSVSRVFIGENNVMCNIGPCCDDCVVCSNDNGLCLCKDGATSEACNLEDRAEDSRDDAFSESWQEVTESQCDSCDEDNVRILSVDLGSREDNGCSAKQGSTFCDISVLKHGTNISDNDNGICFSDEEDLILHPDNEEFQSGCDKQESMDLSSAGSENCLSYDDIGFYSVDVTDFQTEGMESVPNEQIDFSTDNAEIQIERNITKTYLPNEDIHFIDDVSESNDQKGICTNSAENRNQIESYADNSVSSDGLSSFSEDDWLDDNSEEHANPHEQRSSTGKPPCYQSNETSRTSPDQRLNIIDNDCSCFHRTGGMNSMADEDPRYYSDNDASFENGGSMSGAEYIPTDDISAFSDRDFCDDDSDVASSHETETRNDEKDVQRDEIGFLSDDDLHVPNEEYHNSETISPQMSTYHDNRSNSDKHNHFSETFSPDEEEDGYEDGRGCDDFIFHDKNVGHHEQSKCRSLSLVSTCQCLLLHNVSDVPHTVVETVSFMDCSPSLESNVVNIKGVKLTVGPRIGSMCELSAAEYWLDIRQDLIRLLQDLETKQHSISKTSIEKDFKGCLLRKLRDIDLGRFNHPEPPEQADINARPFPVPSEIQSDPPRLRPWLNNWIPFDTGLPESGCAWKELEYSGDFAETSEAIDSPWYGEWKPFDMSIEGETAWPNLPDDVITNDVPTKQQLIVIKSREKHKHWQTEDHMAKRRLNLARYFKEKYGFESNIIVGYLGFVTRLKDSDEKLKSLADMDLSFIIV